MTRNVRKCRKVSLKCCKRPTVLVVETSWPRKHVVVHVIERKPSPTSDVDGRWGSKWRPWYFIRICVFLIILAPDPAVIIPDVNCIIKSPGVDLIAAPNVGRCPNQDSLQRAMPPTNGLGSLSLPCDTRIKHYLFSYVIHLDSVQMRSSHFPGIIPWTLLQINQSISR